MHLSTHLSIHPFMQHPSVYPSIHLLTMNPSIHHLSIHPPIHPPGHPHILQVPLLWRTLTETSTCRGVGRCVLTVLLMPAGGVEMLPAVMKQELVCRVLSISPQQGQQAPAVNHPDSRKRPHEGLRLRLCGQHCGPGTFETPRLPGPQITHSGSDTPHLPEAAQVARSTS